MTKPYIPMFFDDLGHSWQVSGNECVGEISVVEELCLPGTQTMRASVLATIADVVAGGVANVKMAPRIPLTVDLTLHPLRHPVDATRLRMVGRNVKAGRTTTINEVVFSDETGAPVAVSHATFMPSPRPEDVMAEVHWGREPAPPRLARPILEQIGVRSLGPGIAELDLVEYVMQPSGTIQGGALAMMAELAASTLAEAPVTDLEIRYLSAVRVGPGRATATLLGGRLVRVEVRDAGNADRLATLIVARTG
ncbi:MAG: PaaI family thioesterase [Acidimicrobiales bacterium]